MECNALVKPQQLAQLISELDDAPLRSVRDDAYVCDIPAQNDPGRKQLWIIPTDAKLGANPNLWIKTHHELLDEVIDRSIGYATIIFAGSLPAAVERRRVDVHACHRMVHGNATSRTSELCRGLLTFGSIASEFTMQKATSIGPSVSSN